MRMVITRKITRNLIPWLHESVHLFGHYERFVILKKFTVQQL